MILIDGNNFAWRGHHSAPDLEDGNGMRTGALHVGLMMLAHLASRVERQRMIVLWDGWNYWRKDFMPEYKAHRSVTDEQRELRESVRTQIGIFRSVLVQIGVAQAAHPALEADDLAGIISQRVGDGEEVLLASSDKDWFQLLGDGITQVRKWSATEWDEWDASRVIAEFGVPPGRWAEFLALTGDKVDNIPKVRKGVGPVSARKLLMGDSGLDVHLTQEELFAFKENLRVTELLREMPYGDSLRETMVVPSLDDEDTRWERLTRILDAHQLDAVKLARRELWDLGKWR